MDNQEVTTFQVNGVSEWRATANQVLLPLKITTAEHDEIHAEISTIAIDGIRVIRITANSHYASRNERLQGHGSDPYFSVVYQHRGTSKVAQHGQAATLQPGDFTVYDASSPYERAFGAGTTLVIMVPQQLMALPPRAFGKMSALRIPADSGAGAVCAGLLSGIAENPSALEGRAGSAILQATIDLVAACIADSLEIAASSRSQSQLALLMKVREYIMSHLGDSDLGPHRIAEAHFISVRTLHQLFKDQGATVGTWIRERRLEMARRDLMDLQNDDPIRVIGQRWGFTEPTHFSNAFKAAYGYSPRQCRQAARQSRDALS